VSCFLNIVVYLDLFINLLPHCTTFRTMVPGARWHRLDTSIFPHRCNVLFSPDLLLQSRSIGHSSCSDVQNVSLLAGWNRAILLHCVSAILLLIIVVSGIQRADVLSVV